MHTDARLLPDNTHIEGDICIVGTGPAGLSIAMEWNHTPYKVILLEGGGFEYDDQMQDLYGGPETGQHYYPLQLDPPALLRRHQQPLGRLLLDV